MGDLLKFKTKKGKPTQLEIAKQLSHEIAAVINKYHGNLSELMLAGVVSAMLAQIILKSSNYRKTLHACVSYILDRVEEHQKETEFDEGE